MRGKKIVFFCLMVSLCFATNGQTEAEILDQANNYFKEEKFVEATPLYLRLLSLQPKNVDYNYRYGTCLLFNANKKQESMRYLKYATENEKVEPQAYFYMGRSYHLNYLFNDAVRSYDKYTNLVGQKVAENQEVPHLIQMCQDGRRLLMNYSEMIVYEKKEIEADKFFRLYDLKDIGGNLLVTADFQSKIDKKKEHTPLIYFPKSASEIYYSSYGESEAKGKEIYRRLRKPTGGWGEPELVKGEVNTNFDEDFAYRSQDGKFLYFCSKGHNSMGGYDVFRSVYDKASDSFIETENMDFAISSPDDDIFFLVDQNNQNGYFASSRQSETGKLNVYKIRVEKLPTQLSIIAGVFESKVKQNSIISVEVLDIATNAIVGKFSSKEDGKILITFPNGGQFKYLMRLDGEEKVYSQNVNIPIKKSIKPLRQNLVHFMENGVEVVRVLDRFDEAVLEKDEILAALFSDKAQLIPNAQNFDLDKLDILSRQKKILTEIAAPNLTVYEVATDLMNMVNAINEVENQTILFEHKTTNLIDTEINNLKSLDEKITKNATSYRASAANSMSRQDLLTESKILLEQRNKTKEKIEDLLVLNKKVQDNLIFYKDLKIRAKDWEQKSTKIKQLLAEDKNAEALQYIEENKVVIKSGLTAFVGSYQDKTSKEISDLSVEITELNRNKYNYETSAKDLQNNIDFMERSLFEKNASNEDITKEGIALKKTDLDVINEEIVAIGKRIEAQRKSKDKLVDDLSEFMSVENSPKPKTIASYQDAKDKWEQVKNSSVSADYQLLAQAIQGQDNQNITIKSKEEWIATINPDFKKEVSTIKNNSNLSELNKSESLVKAEQENQLAIKKAIDATEKLREKDPENEIIKQNKETLFALLETSNKDLAVYARTFEEEKSKNSANSLTELSVIQSIDKNYDDIVEFINKDVVSDQKSKLKSLNDHDTEFLRKVEGRIRAVDNLLKTDASRKAELMRELDLLTNLKVKKDSEVEARKNLLFELENQLALIETPPETKIQDPSNTQVENPIGLPEKTEIKFSDLSLLDQEIKVLSKANPTYTLDKEGIENAESSSAEKIALLTELNNSTLSVIKQEKKTLNKRTQSAEIAALERIESKISTETRQIEANVLSRYEEPEQIIDRLSENYRVNFQAINNNESINSIEKEEQKIALNKTLLAALEKEKESFEKLAVANSGNEIVRLKIEFIDQLQAEYAQLMAGNERKLDELIADLVNTPEEVSSNSAFTAMTNLQQEEFILSMVSSDYEAEKERIKQSKASELIKTNAYLALDNALLEKLNSEKAKLNRTTDEMQLDAIKRIADKTIGLISFNEIKRTDLEALADVSNASNNPVSENTETNSFKNLPPAEQERTVVVDVLPNYYLNKASIEQSIENEKVKYRNLLALENELANKLANEKEKLNQTNDAEKLATIMKVEKVLNASIANNKLNLLAANETADELTSRLAKDYLKNKQQLAINPNLSEVEKAKRQLGVDQLMLESLEKEKEKFSNLSVANPLNEKLKEKEIFIFDQIVAKQNEMMQLSALISGDLAIVSSDPKENNPPTKEDNFASASDLRQKLLGEVEPTFMRASLNSNSLSELKAELTQLEKYEINLKKIETEISERQNASSIPSQNQLMIIGTELKEVETKKRQYTISIGDLEQDLLASKTNKAPKIDNTLERILKEERELSTKLEGEITSLKEIRKIEKQLTKLAEQKIEHKNELLTNESRDVSKDTEVKTQALAAIQTTSVSERVNKELALKRSNQLTEDAAILREVAGTIKNGNQASELLEKALSKEKQANEILEIALVDNKVTKLTEGKIATLLTKEELEQRRKTLLVEEASYNSEIKNIDLDIKASKNNKEELALIANRALLSKERIMIVDQIAFIDKKIGQLPSQPVATIALEKKETELSFQQEVELSSSLEYKEIFKVAKEVFFIENEIAFLLKSIDKSKQDAQKIVEQATVDGNRKDNANAEAIIKEIQGKEERLLMLKENLGEKQGILKNLFPSDQNEKARIENLLLRGIEPIRTEISNYIPIPEKGFEVDASATKTENKVLAVDAKVPTGLMFRVQVGAFSKPVAVDAFQEFNPVTGEKRSNGITVYMAGFFDKSASAADAQKTIRSLGYSDAFVVAYCDGERIPLSEGRRMEESKDCKPMQLQDLTIQRTPSPKDTTKLITRELDYNKAIGAAPAFPVELKKGLFYTVQIGVYNKPVDPSTIKNLTPLITKRLPNGQIRYSAGVYVSIEEAMPKRKEAIEKGILDAYITAYFGSERISLIEAEQLLQDRGIGIIEKTAIGIVKDVQQRIVAEENLQKEIVAVEKKRFEEGMGIQLVSKETFTEFPRDMLNRFNKHISFYFDQNEKRLKSSIYEKVEDIPQIHFLRDDLDTVFIANYKKVISEEKVGFKKIIFYGKKGQLDGDVADFIFRLNFRKEYIDQADNMKVILHNVPSSMIQFISDELRNLKVRSVVE